MDRQNHPSQPETPLPPNAMDARALLLGEELLRDPEIWERVQRIHTPDGRTALVLENLIHIFRLHGALCERFNAHLAPYGLSLAKYNLLMLLRNAPDNRLPMSEVGAKMSVSCANITKLVDALTRDGLVCRARLPEDRRVVLAELTEQGEALLQKIQPTHHANARRLWGSMEDTDCALLTHLLTKLRRNVLASSPLSPAEDSPAQVAPSGAAASARHDEEDAL